MTELPIRRVGCVLAVYLFVAWLILIVANWLQGVLALPPLFRTLTVGVLIVGVPLAVLIAWKYPEVGVTDDGRSG